MKNDAAIMFNLPQEEKNALILIAGAEERKLAQYMRKLVKQDIKKHSKVVNNANN